MEAPLLQTKLYIPPTRPEAQRVSRPRLIERLNTGIHAGHKLTLVSAPAGFGKTTCISAWLRSQHRQVAWLSLDAADDDPVRFFTYLIAALQKLDANLGCDIDGVLRAGQLPPGNVISAILINDILTVAEPFLLVLDDFQVIQERVILDVLSDLVSNLPAVAHLVLITREDPSLPLARLRANNQLTEIRALDLRFTVDEVAYFLRQVMGLSLSQQDVMALEDKTEGWIAGLQLAAIALQASPATQDQGNATGLIESLNGSHRYILSYLTEQVLDQQPETIRRFLLETSILDQLNGDLCNAVTGRADSHMLLERILNANLFITAMDVEGQWYRYHQLFASLLRDQLTTQHSDRIPELHRRASRWYTDAGLESEAIQHAIAAQDYGMAVDLLERHATRLISLGYANTVHSWLQAIPPEFALESPHTNLAFAWMHLLRGDYTGASPYMERLQAIFIGSDAMQSNDESASLRAEWLVIQSLVLHYKPGQARAGVVMASKALTLAPEQDSRVLGLVHWALASFYQLLGEYDRAVRAYQASIRHGRAAENLVAEMMSTAGLAVMAFEQGQLHLAYEIAAATSARIERAGVLPPICALLYGVFSEVEYQWMQLEPAKAHAQRVIQLSTLGGFNTGVIGCRTFLSRLAQLEGALETAEEELHRALELLPVNLPDYIRQETASQQVRLYLQQDRLAAAHLVLQAEGFSFQGGFVFPDILEEQEFSYSLGLLYNSSLRALLYQAKAQHNPALLATGFDLVNSIITRATQEKHVPIALESLLLRARMHALTGNDSDSRTDYMRALHMAQPEGYISVFVEQGQVVAEGLSDLLEHGTLDTTQRDYAQHILAVFPGIQVPVNEHPGEAQMTALVEPLSERELDVLRLMAEGLKYKEIAGSLYISVNTVRYHVKAIYGKLGVNNRTQALEAARQHQLL